MLKTYFPAPTKRGTILTSQYKYEVIRSNFNNMSSTKLFTN